MKKNASTEPELSRPLRVEKISPNGVEETVVATEREKAALAERFDLVEVKNLQAKLHIMPECAGLNFAVKGRLSADVVQRCVVTLEPLPATIAVDIHVHFAAPEFFADATAERDLDEDDLEPIQNSVIDLGELAAQHLGLALDPYPRKADLPPLEAEFGAPVAPESPFAKLVVLKDRLKE